MQINPSDRYLSILQSTLKSVIAPELTTSAAKAAASLMEAILVDLLKREHGSRDILRAHIVAGCDLAAEICSALKRQPPTAINAVDDFGKLSIQDQQITQQLTQLCEQLVAADLPHEEIASLLRRVAEWELAYYKQQAALPAPVLPVIAQSGTPLSKESLEAFLNSDRDDPVTLRNFEPLSGGFGKQTYLCAYEDRKGATHEIVVRKTDPTPIMTHAACDLENEYALLCTLAPLDYPAPKPQRFAAHWQNVDGSFYTMPRIAGANPGTFLGGLHGAVDEVIMLELAELLGRLHSIPLETFAHYASKYDEPRILEGTIADCYRYNLERWRRYIHRENYLPSPYLSWLLDWLFRNIPKDTRRPILIHGDFNVHNVLVHDGHISGVLDWECAGFGAPEQDLAYIQPNISQHIDWNKFVAHYQAHGGYEINPEAMAFGVVYAALRTNLAGNRATQNLQNGANVDVRYAMVELGFTRSFMELALLNAK